ncbi:hypothetical protein [Laspinema olomoucense]|uniref:hypothetical protein n=1 Tax=Laspinema olomoucense TaxID=3231600 RepID=UPI0021BB7597|nr:hypothetical protein [Laspinema sp. D3c]MCT7995952.1 hypothetical protein [Laspinema sp. D3c]
MTSRLMDYLGEWNPQFVRELKGRLISRNVTLAVGLSLLAQLVIFLAFISQIPAPDAPYGSYCIYQENNPCVINWMQWKEDLHQVFYWVLPLVLISGGVYLLIADLAREEQRGTLNFIRVSPQSSQSILIGKLLGVPVLLYLAVAIALPSYAATAMVAQIPLLEVWSFYVLLAALCAVFYSAAALFALMGGHQALVGAGVTLGMLFWLMHQEWYSYGKDWVSHQWFGFPLNGDNLFNVRLFALANCGIWTYWIWQGLHRRFRNTAATMISKKQSYTLVFCVNVLFLGLVASYLSSEYDPKLSGAYLWFDSLRFIAILNLFLFLGLIAALSPPRQTLLDWARYAHQAKRQSVLQDLIWGEKSPASVAIAICATITALVFIPWVLLWPLEMLPKLQAISAIGFYVILAAIYAVLAQIMLLLKSKKRALWATGVVAAAIGLPLLTLALLGGQAQTIPELYLLSILSLSGLEYATTTPIFMAFLGHLAMLAGLSVKLRQQLNRAGESATKALLMGRKVS